MMCLLKNEHSNKKEAILYPQAVYEQRSFIQHFKDIVYLTVFVILAAIISIIVMNLLTYPVLLLVNEGTELFTRVFIYTLLFIIALFILSKLISTIKYYIASDLPLLKIIPQILIGRIKAFFILITSTVFVVLLLLALYSLFTYNNKFIINLFS